MALAMKVKKGDLVQVLSGKDRGKQGRVIEARPDERRVLVENLNVVKRHTKPRGQKAQGGILEREAPIHVSNVMHLCPKCQMGVRVTMKRGQDGKRERYCARCGEAIARVR